LMLFSYACSKTSLRRVMNTPQYKWSLDENHF